MNREWVLFHLREAATELDSIIREIQDDPSYGYGAFSVDMAHLYHHLNTAWNSKAESAERVKLCSQEDFDAWRRFPLDLPL